MISVLMPLTPLSLHTVDRSSMARRKTASRPVAKRVASGSENQVVVRGDQRPSKNFERRMSNGGGPFDISLFCWPSDCTDGYSHFLSIRCNLGITSQVTTAETPTHSASVFTRKLTPTR